MTSQGKTWIAFCLAVLIVGCALGWISMHLLRFEEEHSLTDARERFRANLRLAVWRIDSLMAPVLAEEAARPPSHYRAFYPLSRSYDTQGMEQKSSQVFVPSPLLNPRNELTTLNFQVSSRGEWTSPQVPPDFLVPNAFENGVSPSRLAEQKSKLAQLSSTLDPAVLGDNLSQAFAAQGEPGSDPNRWFLWNDPVPVMPGAVEATRESRAQEDIQYKNFKGSGPRTGQADMARSDQQQSVEDFNARKRALNRFADQQQQSNVEQVLLDSNEEAPDVQQGQGVEAQGLSDVQQGQSAEAEETPDVQQEQNAEPQEVLNAQQEQSAKPQQEQSLKPLQQQKGAEETPQGAAGPPQPQEIGNDDFPQSDLQAQSMQARVSPLVPLWLPLMGQTEPSLVLVRRVEVGTESSIQGVLVDWPGLKKKAEKEVIDLFPHAVLNPRDPGTPLDPDRTLAVFPATLDPGPFQPDGMTKLWTPVRIGLGLIWLAYLSGILVTAAALRSLLTLNQRRLDFVSAVTHELRTPLTTFSMYTEMLKEGMVPEDKEQNYYTTLNHESLRLNHLVQNVLDYSRLESQRMAFRKVGDSLSSHLERILPPLEDRCNRDGIPFSTRNSLPGEQQVAMDPSAVGQILLNLVDNACKYGEGEISLSIHCTGERLTFTLSDQGQGIQPAERERIFSPFYRSPQTRESNPGIGLGLALCRRWAREMGGNLKISPKNGSHFLLELPL